MGCALNNIGTDQFLNAIVTLCPAADSRKEIEVEDNNGKKMLPCSESGQPIAFVFKTLSEEHLGEFNLTRVFSGKLTTGLDVQNSKSNNIERIANMYYLRGKERTDTTEVVAGDIAGLLKLKNTHTNEIFS